MPLYLATSQQIALMMQSQSDPADKEDERNIVAEPLANAQQTHGAFCENPEVWALQ